MFNSSDASETIALSIAMLTSASIVKGYLRAKCFLQLCSMSMFHSQTLVSAFFDNKRGEVFKLWVVTRKLSSDKQEL